MMHGSHLLVIYSDPVRLSEKRMCFDVGDTVLHIAKSSRDVRLEQVLDEVANVGTERRREPHLCMTYANTYSRFNSKKDQQTPTAIK